MVVLFHRDVVDVLFRREGRFPGLGPAQVGFHGGGVHVVLHAQPHRGIFPGVQNVVAFVLGIAHVEGILDVLGERVHLQGQVLAAHRVQHVEADGELLAEAGVDAVAQQGTGLLQHQVQGRGLDERAAEVQQQAVFLGHAVKAPSIVAAVFRQFKVVLHPVAAPHARVKVGHHAEGTAGGLAQSFPVGRAVNHGGFALGGHVQIEVHGVEQVVFFPVGPAPFRKKAPLVLFQLGQVGLGGAPVGHAAAVAQLDLPTGDVRHPLHVAGMDQAGSHAVDQHGALGGFDAAAGLFDLVHIEEILQPPHRHDAEDGVVGEQVGFQGGVQLFRLKGQVVAVDDQVRVQGFQPRQQFFLIHAGVTFHAEHLFALHRLTQGRRNGGKALADPGIGAVDLDAGIDHIPSGICFFHLGHDRTSLLAVVVLTA